MNEMAFIKFYAVVVVATLKQTHKEREDSGLLKGAIQMLYMISYIYWKGFYEVLAIQQNAIDFLFSDFLKV